LALKSYCELPLLWRVFAVLGLVFAAVSLLPYLFAAANPAVPPLYANKDFANYWTAGQLLRTADHLDLFGPQPGYFRHMAAYFGDSYPWHGWSYPPHFLLALWPLGYTNYEWGLLLFLAATGAMHVLALRKFAGRAFPAALVAALPFAAHNMQTAQNGFLSAALILGALALRQTRPVMAGVILGCLTFKPQLGILFPFLLLFERNWAMLLSASLTTAALALASVLAFGMDSWLGFFGNVVPYQNLVMRELTGVFVSLLTSLFGYGRLIGLPADAALVLHLCLAAPVFLIALYAFFKAGDPKIRSVVLITATLLVTPYALSYDFGAAAAAAALLLTSSATAGAARQAFLIFAAATPVIMIPAASVFLPVAQIALLGLFAMAVSDSGIFHRRSPLSGPVKQTALKSAASSN
jgi:arabinofuranan 3-O-arabinosyltransferase